MRTLNNVKFKKGQNDFEAVTSQNGQVKSLSVSDGNLSFSADGTNFVNTANSQQVNNMIANDYDNTQTYAVGDVVIYGNTLYRCTTPVTTAGDWDSTKWTATTLEELIPTNAVTLGTETQTFSGSKDLKVPYNSSFRILSTKSNEIAFNFKTAELEGSIYYPSVGFQTTNFDYIKYRNGKIFRRNGISATERNYSFPSSKSGTFALTSDIPTSFDASQVNSTGASGGDVLIADGIGGAYWGASGGGGGGLNPLYQHNILITFDDGTRVVSVSTTILSYLSSPVYDFSSLSTLAAGAGSSAGSICASGSCGARNGDWFIVRAINMSNSSNTEISFDGIQAFGGNYTSWAQQNVNFSDEIIQL